MITTPNRLRDPQGPGCDPVDKEGRGPARPVVLKPIGRSAVSGPRRFRSFVRSFEEPPSAKENNLALRQSAPLPVVESSCWLSAPRFPRPEHLLSLFLCLYYYVFAIYLCLHPPAFYFPSPFFLVVSVRGSKSRRPPTEPPSHTPGPQVHLGLFGPSDEPHLRHSDPSFVNVTGG